MHAITTKYGIPGTLAGRTGGQVCAHVCIVGVVITTRGDDGSSAHLRVPPATLAFQQPTKSSLSGSEQQIEES
jgi:hypothetical protein